MEYLRPKTIDEAVELLAGGIPLAGGTRLNVDRSKLARVIDLQGLGLDILREVDGSINIGAMTKLQSLLSTDLPIPEALRAACRYEAAWNLRNQGTIGGLLMSASGRSPLLTVLSALSPRVHLEPGNAEVSLGELLERRKQVPIDFILLDFRFQIPTAAAYDYVARTPMDPPLVSAAAALHDDGGQRTIHLAVGGFGDHPSFWKKEHSALDQEEILASVTTSAQKVAENAGDDFASAAYRAEVAGILIRRVVSEVLE